MPWYDPTSWDAEDYLNVGTGGSYGVAKGGYDLAVNGDPKGALEAPVSWGTHGFVNGDDVVEAGMDLGGLLPEMPGAPSSSLDDAQARMLAEMQRAALEYQKYRPEVRQARMNAMRQQSQAYQPANNALQTMYGASFNPGSMFDDPFGPSVDTPSGMPLPPQGPPQAPPTSQPDTRGARRGGMPMFPAPEAPPRRVPGRF